MAWSFALGTQEHHGVDTSQYGLGTSKTVADLLDEVCKLKYHEPDNTTDASMQHSTHAWSVMLCLKSSTMAERHGDGMGHRSMIAWLPIVGDHAAVQTHEPM